MFNKLNGWQRLWVLVSIVLLIAFALFAYRDRPRSLGEFPATCNEIANRLMSEWEKNNFKTPKTHEESNYYYRTAPFKMETLYLYPEFRTCADKALLYKQITFVIKVLSVWLATIVFIYVTGISVAWVRSGFRHKKEY